MAAVERQRELPGRLAAPGRVSTRTRIAGAMIAVAALVTACVPPDEETTSFDAGSAADQTLPSVTSTTAAPTSASEDDGSTGEPEPATTSSTETTAPLPELQGLDAEPVASGFDQPIHVVAVPGTDTLVVAEREGIVRVVDLSGSEPTVADEPFLDLRDRLLSSSIEQGLLGLAFHPDFADNGQVYAYWTDPEGDSHLARFQVPPDLPQRADPDSQETILTVDQPAERHNAGHLQFGPDGLLYVALGDGGSGGATAQDITNPLGSILRLDVDAAGTSESYAIPDGNPYGDEIWVHGLRNPWRFSIDAPTATMYIGDVGQDRWEEINVVGLDGAGTNFGWIEREGAECFRSGCATEGFTDPILQYGHDEGCSVTGGRVYRGAAIPEFAGHYFYADWCGGLVRSFRLDGQGLVTDQFDWTDELAELGQVTSFGVDADGELLVVNWAGELYRIVPVR